MVAVCGGRVKKHGPGGKYPVAKVIYGEQGGLVVNDVIAMGTAKPYAKSNRLSLIGLRGHSSGGWLVNKAEHEKRTTLWYDPFTNAVTVWLPATATFQYDANGNLLSDGKRGFVYDDENQLTRVTVTNVWKTEFQYDGKMRLRVRKEYAWRSGAFTPTNEVRYVYDGMLVIQERNAGNIPLATYTRGLDRSSSRQGAGGIGGLLARTDNGLWNGSGTDGAHTYYSADGNGNITCLLNSKQIVVGRYMYDPYGNTLSLSGPQAEANPYRFSSKEYMVNSGLYAYGYRFYEPSLQRWVNRDPIGEFGGINLYGFIRNSPVAYIDRDGLDVYELSGMAHSCYGIVDHTFVFITDTGETDDQGQPVNYVVNFDENGESVRPISISLEEYILNGKTERPNLRIRHHIKTTCEKNQGLIQFFKRNSPKQKYSFPDRTCRTTYDRARANIIKQRLPHAVGSIE